MRCWGKGSVGKISSLSPATGWHQNPEGNNGPSPPVEGQHFPVIHPLTFQPPELGRVKELRVASLLSNNGTCLFLVKNNNNFLNYLT